MCIRQLQGAVKAGGRHEAVGQVGGGRQVLGHGRDCGGAERCQPWLQLLHGALRVVGSYLDYVRLRPHFLTCVIAVSHLCVSVSFIFYHPVFS